MPCRAFFRSVRLFLFALASEYAAIHCEALAAFLAALRACFCFGFALLVSLLHFDVPVEARTLCVLRFVGVGSILYRTIFPWLVGGLFCLIRLYRYFTTFFHFYCHFFPFCDFRSEIGSNGRLLFWGFCIRVVFAYVKLLQGLGVCVGGELLQANVKKYHGKGCVSYPICCSHRGYVGSINCCR